MICAKQASALRPPLPAGPAGPGESRGVEGPLKKLKTLIKGSATRAKDPAKALRDGKFYVNLHIAAHGDSELRGHDHTASLYAWPRQLLWRRVADVPARNEPTQETEWQS